MASGFLVACGSASRPAAVTRPSASAPLPSTTYPNALVVLGHSGTTGANSDPDHQGDDERQNSWATGDNPEVNSIYSRLLAVNPAVRGHNSNFGVDGSDVDDLAAQVAQALAVNPIPDLFIIQEVDNDMQCDGTDAANYPRFARTLTGVLEDIVAAAPKATILLVSSPPGTVDNYGHVVERLPRRGRGQHGRRAVRPVQQRRPGRPGALAVPGAGDPRLPGAAQDGLRQFTQCRYDGGALYRMVITAADLAPDAQHRGLAGWRRIGDLNP